MITFETYDSVIFDKIEKKDIRELEDALGKGRKVYDSFSKLRFFMVHQELQILDLKNASPTGDLKCKTIIIPVCHDESVFDYDFDYDFGYLDKTLRDILEPMLSRGDNLNMLLGEDYLEKHLLEIKSVIKKGEYIAGYVPFNPLKSDKLDLPKILWDELDSKVLAYYLINSNDIEVKRFDKANPKDASIVLSACKEFEFASKLFFTKGLQYQPRTNRVLSDGFDVTFTLSGDFRFQYRIIYNEPINVEKIIDAVETKTMSIETLPKKYLISRVIVALININPYNIEKISSISLKEEDYKLAVSIDGGVLALIPEDKKTLDICKIAVENEPYAKAFLPKNLKELLI